MLGLWVQHLMSVGQVKMQQALWAEALGAASESGAVGPDNSGVSAEGSRCSTWQQRGEC